MTNASQRIKEVIRKEKIKRIDKETRKKEFLRRISLPKLDKVTYLLTKYFKGYPYNN